jgi:hypothetical protein
MLTTRTLCKAWLELPAASVVRLRSCLSPPISSRPLNAPSRLCSHRCVINSGPQTRWIARADRPLPAPLEGMISKTGISCVYGRRSGRVHRYWSQIPGVPPDAPPGQEGATVGGSEERSDAHYEDPMQTPSWSYQLPRRSGFVRTSLPPGSSSAERASQGFAGIGAY